MPNRLFVAGLACAGLVALLVLLNRADAQPDPVDTYVGRVDGSDAFVAFARTGDLLMAYVCDGRTTAAWFRGVPDGRSVRLTAGEAELRATLADDAIEGTFAAGTDGPRTFVARPAPRGGFYRASATLGSLAYVGGWILLDGEQRGAVKRGGAVVADVEPLDPARPTLRLADGAVLAAEPTAALLTAEAAAP